MSTPNFYNAKAWRDHHNRPLRSDRFPRVSPEELEKRLQRSVEVTRDIIKDLEGVSIGYIGNCSRDFDDRSWMIFLPHPERIGTAADHIGGYPSSKRSKLVADALTLRKGYDLGVKA